MKKILITTILLSVTLYSTASMASPASTNNHTVKHHTNKRHNLRLKANSHNVKNTHSKVALTPEDLDDLF